MNFFLFNFLVPFFAAKSDIKIKSKGEKDYTTNLLFLYPFLDMFNLYYFKASGFYLALPIVFFNDSTITMY